MSKGRVLLGMSGGVDSSVAAMMLQKDGYEVVGLTFIFSELKEQNEFAVKEAQKLAQEIGIEHFVCDLRSEFTKLIVNYFTQEYQKGRTPFPCAICNPELKFKNLLKNAEIYHCNYIATGHYARIKKHKGKQYIFEGTDTEKDQSFFLWGLDKEVLNKLILPLGALNKMQTREYANTLGFSCLSQKKDSLGICFIEENNYRKFLKSKCIEFKRGYFVDKEGRVLGRHSGILNYTIGQRRGLGISANKPMFVSGISATTNEIVLSDYEDLYKNKILVSNMKCVDIQEFDKDKVFIVRIRYRLQNTPCKINILHKDQAIVYLLEPVAMVANGQTAVFYDGNRLVGGGFIESSE
ncbi:tRNA 2-thiouridine(34) synthase MnmA [Maribellus maritimus]|uniref:tRNA 2-thiouridine(34) synthase MnmA n=1 Tax=Maribellus maritimus TaxID=2870838 RepID=UPI001EECD159|nr:tRNA 2-thiouridine(34) synthase MnmA [Maribellus maritimus]MCG6190750.1 tRNA 2-thiouridine(34) synthase MnmA [Maribellus maritimus]